MYSFTCIFKLFVFFPVFDLYYQQYGPAYHLVLIYFGQLVLIDVVGGMRKMCWVCAWAEGVTAGCHLLRVDGGTSINN